MPTKVSTTVSMGPNEAIYMERYDALITKVLADSVPSYRQDYYSLPKPRRDDCLESVNALLERIALSSVDSPVNHQRDENNASIELLGEESFPEPDSDDQLNTPTRDQLSCNSIGMGQLSQDDFGHVHDDESNTTDLPSTKYRLLEDKIRQELENDCRSYADQDVDTSVNEQDCSSVELGRDALVDRGRDSSMLLLSPVAWNSHDGRNRHGNKKRQATTSAKKGLGVQRSRRNSDEEIECWGSPDHGNRYDDMYMSNAAVDSPLADGCVGPNHEKENQRSLSFLLQSQSPIEKCGTYDSCASRDNERSMAARAADSPIRPRRTIDFGRDNGAFSPMRNDASRKPLRRSRSRPGNRKVTATDDTIESVNCTVLPRGTRLRTRGNVQTSETAQPLVQLKDGVCFRMNPLKMHHPLKKVSRSKSDKQRRPRTTAIALSSSDPLEVFSSRTAERLDYVVQWLKEKDLDFDCQVDKENSSPDVEAVGQSCLGKAVVLSLESEQIRAVTLKVLHLCGARSSASYSAHNSGGTLLVLRDKAEMIHWERMFRERSSLSVMNHGSLSPAARKRLSVDRCAGFDVVLTTFDSIKAKEKTFALDDIGRAVVQNPAQSGRWHASRSGGVVHCKQLCLLHGIIWRRVVFTDILGRGSYTLKSQTARCLAGRALNGFVRFLFYAQFPGDMEEALKESAQQLRSVAKIMHVCEDSAADSIIGDSMIDLNDISPVVDSSAGDRCMADTSLNDSEITAPN